MLVAALQEEELKVFQCPHGLELLLKKAPLQVGREYCFNALTGLSCYDL